MSRRTHAHDLSFFDGVPAGDLGKLLGSFERRTYPAGSIVIAEGDRMSEMYIAEAGSAEVVVSDLDGTEHRVGRVVPGGTVGEISLLTGQPAVATVRATADLDVLVMKERDFALVAESHPEVYRNLGTLLAERLVRTNRLVAGRREGQLAVLENEGAPPLLAYAIASSVAWHTREPTLLLVIGDEPAPDLTDLATTQAEPPWRSGRGSDAPGADVMIAPAAGAFAPQALPGTIEALFRVFGHILIEAAPDSLGTLATARHVRLRAAGDGRAPGELLTIRAWATSDSRSRPAFDRIVDVPGLVAEDERELQQGLLSQRSAAGRELGWAARDLAELKVGLALGAGSLRGYAHLGVIDVLTRAGVPYDYIAGTSVGSAVATLLSTGHDLERIGEILDDFSPNLFRLALPYRSLLSSRGIRGYIQRFFGDARLEELPIPTAVVVADLLEHREIVLRRGPVWQAIVMSISIPGVYPAHRMGRYLLVDGGVLNPVPGTVVEEMGAGRVLAVNLLSGAPLPEQDAEAVPTTGRPPSAVVVMLRSIELMQGRMASGPHEKTTITIAPMLEPAGARLRRFKEGRRYIEHGEAAAEAALPRIAAALPWLRP